MGQISDSKFAVWRCLIIMANIDGHFSEEEREFLEGIHQYDVLSDEQKAILKEDVDTKNTDFDSIYNEISESRDRAHLINLTRVLFHKDGSFCPIEQGVLDKIDGEHKKTINLENILKEARNVSVADVEQHQIKMDKVDDVQGGGVLGTLFNFLSSPF